MLRSDDSNSGILIISSPASGYVAYEWINTQQSTEWNAERCAQRNAGISKLEANVGVTRPSSNADVHAYEKKIASLPTEPVTLKALQNELIFWHNHYDQLRTRLSLFRSLAIEHHRYIQEKKSSSPLPLPHYHTALDTIWSQPASYRDRVWQDFKVLISRLIALWESGQHQAPNHGRGPPSIGFPKLTYFPILNQTPGTLTALESLGIAIGETTFFLPADVDIQRLRDAISYMNSKHVDKYVDRLKSLDRLVAKAKSTSTSTTSINSTMIRGDKAVSRMAEEKAPMEQEMNAVKDQIQAQKIQTQEGNGMDHNMYL